MGSVGYEKGSGITGKAELVAGVFEAAEQLCLTGSCLGSDVPVLCCLNHREPLGQIQY